MRLLRGRVGSGTMPGGAVVTIGKFDGLHRGHRALLAEAAARGQSLGLPVVLVSFEPSPEEFFAGENAYPRLTRFVSKWRLVAATEQVDAVACLRFNAAFAARCPEDFVRETLVAGLNAKAVIVGEAFRFGHRRRGDVALLERMGRRCGFETVPVAPVGDGEGRISSSRVRVALSENRLDDAAALLGRPYRLYGRVVAGEKLGGRLGYPTANLALGRRPPPLAGIYVVHAEGLPGGARYGMASVGERPTVAGRRRLLEVYFPGFTGDLYGRLLAVDFLDWLRAEARFASLDKLAAAIGKDVAIGEAWLAERGLDWKAADADKSMSEKQESDER
ncbi:MAG: bifunctional riboflavin kinase/FAD synthetase [Gammaproteobacteria bacterium]